LLDEYLDVTEIAPSAYPPAGAFDVTVFDGVAPTPSAGSGGLVYLNPPPSGSPVKLGKPLEGFGFDTWDKKSPIVRFTALGDVQVAVGNALEPTEGDKIVGASDDGPILVSGSRGGHRFVALGFDPRRSDFVLRPAWPLFVLNTIDSFGETDASYLSSYRTGEVWRVPVPDGARSAELVEPGGARRPVPVQDGRAVTFGNQAGVYKLTTGTGAERVVSEFAANLSDLEESHILPRDKLVIAGREASKPELWALLLAAVLILSMVEWVTYHRRVTV
jgi:hypothetical protein